MTDVDMLAIFGFCGAPGPHSSRPHSILRYRTVLREIYLAKRRPPHLEGGLSRAPYGGNPLSGRPTGTVSIAQRQPIRYRNWADGGHRRANIQLDGVLVLEDASNVGFEDNRWCGILRSVVDGCACKCECRLAQCVPLSVQGARDRHEPIPSISICVSLERRVELFLLGIL